MLTGPKTLLDDRGITLPSSGIYGETFNFMIMKDSAENKHEALTRFLAAIDKATTFVRQHKQESQEIVATKLGLERDVMAVLWEDFDFEISLNQSLLLTLEDEARWAIRSALVDSETVPNYLEFVHASPLEAVRPDAMTIIR